MFFSQALIAARSALLSRPIQGASLFSTSATFHAGYKIKSHSGAKKRWRSLASGTAFKRGKAGHSHLNASKSPGRINRLGLTAYATDTQARKLKKVLLPYGSN